MTASPVAVVLPCRNSRHLVSRSLASVAAQSTAPAQIVVLDRGSTDGLGDWLRVRWPGVQRCPLPGGADAAAIGTAIAATVATPAIAWLRPGDYWPRTHLEALLAGNGLLPTATAATPAGAAALNWPEDVAAASSAPRALEEAIGSLPAGPDAILLDLRAAGAPAGLLDLLALASMLGASGRGLRALSLAELSWSALDAMPPTSPILVNLSGPLGLSRASEQLCIEEVLRRSAGRPARLLVGGICPESPPLLSRLLDATSSHPDLEAWVGDAVSRRLAMQLLGRSRVRLVPPPMLALAPLLRQLSERELVQPAMLGNPRAGCDAVARMADHRAWWDGFDPDAAQRLGLALARLLGIWRWLKGPLLQRAWFSALVGWAAMQSEPDGLRTDELEVALFAAICGRRAELTSGPAKQRDLVTTWRALLAAQGIVTV